METITKWMRFRQAAARGLAAIGTQRARVRLYYMSTSDPLDAMREYAKGLLKDLEEARKK